jgi:hypothetical protein
MYRMWKKSLVPHRNGRTETMQKQKATVAICHLVAAVESPHPHKEKKLKKTSKNPKSKPNNYL